MAFNNTSNGFDVDAFTCVMNNQNASRYANVPQRQVFPGNKIIWLVGIGLKSISRESNYPRLKRRGKLHSVHSVTSVPAVCLKDKSLDQVTAMPAVYVKDKSLDQITSKPAVCLKDTSLASGLPGANCHAFQGVGNP